MLRDGASHDSYAASQIPKMALYNAQAQQEPNIQRLISPSCQPRPCSESIPHTTRILRGGYKTVPYLYSSLQSRGTGDGKTMPRSNPQWSRSKRNTSRSSSIAELFIPSPEKNQPAVACKLAVHRRKQLQLHP